MIYQVTFNAHRGFHQEKISVKTWLEFIEQLNILIQRMEDLPDMIYLIDSRP